jgi:SAM-dependent methyltransferase
MPLTLDDWHQRFKQQARWTEALRAHVFSQAGIRSESRILEVGCGTGAVTASAARIHPNARIIGVDIDLPRLRFARTLDPASRYSAGNALTLPFGDGEFDLTFCHFLLLWIREPRKALREMVRVTRGGGWVAALAEPDYGGRIDFPPAFADLGRRQAEALRRQGADPESGRKLAGWLADSGVRIETGGILGSRFDNDGKDRTETEREWKFLKGDLGNEVSEAEWRSLREADRSARADGRRVLYVPTFYAAGTVRL